MQKESIPVGCILPTLVATTRCQYQWERGRAWGEQVEQVSTNDDHQMSLAGVGMSREVCLVDMSRGV